MIGVPRTAVVTLHVGRVRSLLATRSSTPGYCRPTNPNDAVLIVVEKKLYISSVLLSIHPLRDSGMSWVEEFQGLASIVTPPIRAID